MHTEIARGAELGAVRCPKNMALTGASNSRRERVALPERVPLCHAYGSRASASCARDGMTVDINSQSSLATTSTVPHARMRDRASD